jgi:hypothetical protein
LPLVSPELTDTVISWFPQAEENSNTEIRSLRLIATFRGSNGWQAVIAPVGTRGALPTQALLVGDTIGEWTVEDIRTGEVVLRRGQESLNQRLFDRN